MPNGLSLNKSTGQQTHYKLSYSLQNKQNSLGTKKTRTHKLARTVTKPIWSTQLKYQIPWWLTVHHPHTRFAASGVANAPHCPTEDHRHILGRDQPQVGGEMVANCSSTVFHHCWNSDWPTPLPSMASDIHSYIHGCSKHSTMTPLAVMTHKQHKRLKKDKCKRHLPICLQLLHQCSLYSKAKIIWRAKKFSKVFSQAPTKNITFSPSFKVGTVLVRASLSRHSRQSLQHKHMCPCIHKDKNRKQLNFSKDVPVYADDTHSMSSPLMLLIGQPLAEHPLRWDRHPVDLLLAHWRDQMTVACELVAKR